MEILNLYRNACLWSGDAETMREAVEKAVKEGADLRDANLEGANLRGANIGGANIGGAKISRILQIGPIGLRNACLVVWCMADGSRRYSTGCQVQISEEAFLARVSESHGENEHAHAYRAAVEFAHAVHAQPVAIAACGE